MITDLHISLAPSVLPERNKSPDSRDPNFSARILTVLHDKPPLPALDALIGSVCQDGPLH
jgi:hypothetical protein